MRFLPELDSEFDTDDEGDGVPELFPMVTAVPDCPSAVLLATVVRVVSSAGGSSVPLQSDEWIPESMPVEFNSILFLFTQEISEE